MTRRGLLVLLLAAMVVGAAATAFHFAPGAPMAAASRTQDSTHPALHSVSLPLFFEPNQGQTDPRVKFMARGSGYGLFLTADEAVLELRSSASVEKQLAASQPTTQRTPNSVIRMKLDGANSARVSGAEPLPGKSNYFIGNDPAKWRRGISQYARVNYESVYPGVDLVYYGHQGQLEYDFSVAPGADPSQIALHFDGASARLDAGDLVLSTGQGDIRFHAPHIYQPDGKAQKTIAGSFRQLADNKFGFAIGDYDRSRELVIDPILTYSTYLGGTGGESNVHLAVDLGSNIYVAGSTTSANFPVTNASAKTGAQNIFIAKINPSATGQAQLIFATYLGGNASDLAAGVAVDSSFDIYVAGTTTSTNFPTTANAFQTSAPAGTHGFVSKLGLSGSIYSLAYSTYLAGNGIDAVTGLAIDTKQDAFVTGVTTSTDAPSTTVGFPANLNAFQLASQGTSQFFASKINTLGSGFGSMLYSTYFGGGNPAGGQTVGGGIAVDINGNLYITGATNFLGVIGANQEPPFPLLNAQQTCLNEPGKNSSCANPFPNNLDAFAAKINPNSPNAASLVYSTFLGGSNNDTGIAIAVDPLSQTYVTGETFSTDWNAPLSPAPFQSSNGGAPDAFIAKIGNPSGTNAVFPLTYFTYLGGSGVDIGQGIVVDSVQAAHVTGSTSSPNLSTVLQGYGGNTDAFVGAISTTAAAGSYLTYLGGNQLDQGTSIALDSNNDSNPTFVAGVTQSPNFPTVNPFQTQQGAPDAFVAEIGGVSTFAYAASSPTVSPSPATVGNQVTFTFAFVNNGPDSASNVIFSGSLPPPSTFTFNSASASPGGSCPAPVSGKLTCSVGAVASGSQATITVTLTPSAGTTTLTVSPTLSANGGAFTTFASATVSVNDFTVTAAPTSRTVVAGNPASYVVTLTPTSPTNTFTNVTLTMSNSIAPAAAGTTFTFTSSSVTLSGGTPVSTTLNVTTTARPVTTGSLRHSSLFYATVLPIGGLSLVGLSLGVGRKRRRWLAGAVLGLIAGVIILQSACGSSSSSTTTTTGGTPAGTYTITITATSGVAHTVPVTLVVQ